jgi:molybdopterin-guanine dinucleotide biosynthesis protein A
MNARQPIDLSVVTLVVLAGGRGSRMGEPKAWLRLEHRPILDWLLSRMRWPGPTMLVSAPSVAHPPGCELFDCELVDPVDGVGPLRGILTALNGLSTPMATVVTVDMPGVTMEALAWIVQTLADRPQLCGVMCRVRTRDSERVEPFPAAFRAGAASKIAGWLESGNRSVQRLCSNEAFSALEVPAEWSAETWINLNTRADLNAFERKQLARGPGKQK